MRASEQANVCTQAMHSLLRAAKARGQCEDGAPPAAAAPPPPGAPALRPEVLTALEATQGRMDGFFRQLPYKCYLEDVASVGDRLEFCPELDSRVDPKPYTPNPEP